MNEHHALQRMVADLKYGMLEIESHASMVKKKIFDLEKRLAEMACPKEPRHGEMPSTSLAHAKAAESRMSPFEFLDSLH